MILRALTSFVVALATTGCCSTLHRLADQAHVVAAGPDHSYTPPAARYAVEEETHEWMDAARNREVPVRIYTPREAARPWPVIVFSHGVGESRDSYSYFSRAWAARGYAVVNVTHHGTDREMLQRGFLRLYREVKKPENWRNRPLDAGFVLDQLAKEPRYDLSRVVIAGHSAGAFTALAMGGMEIGGTSMRDRRVKAVVALSMPKLGGAIAPDYGKLAVPALNMTGTCDGSLLYRTRPRDRREPFDRAPARGDQYLVILDKVNHNVFSDGESPKNAAIHERIALIALAFIEGYANDDAAARDWLGKGGLAARTDLVVEKR